MSDSFGAEISVLFGRRHAKATVSKICRVHFQALLHLSLECCRHLEMQRN